MSDALRAEFFKVVRRRMTYICLGAAMALVLVFYFVLWLRVRQGPDAGFQGYLEWVAIRDGMAFANVVPYGFALERFFVTLTCVIFAGTMMGNEYDWRTVGLITGRGVKRWHFLAAKLVSGVIFALIAVTLCFFMAMAASAWLTHLYGLSYGSLSLARLGDIVASLLRTVFVVLPFVLMVLLFATQLRSAGQAVGAALGFYFIEGIFTGLLTSAHGWLHHIPEALFNINGDAVMSANGVLHNVAGDFIVTTTGGPSPLQGGLVLAAWIALFAAAAFWRFHHRDLQE